MYNWSREDSTWLRNLLSQPSGARLIETLRAMIPPIKAITKENAWIQAVQKQGEEAMLQKFLNLSQLSGSDLNEGAQSLDLTKEGD